MGGPLVVVPVSALTWWGGCTEGGVVIGDGDIPDGYDRACEVGDPAGVIAVGEGRGQALVLADQPARSCHLPEHRLFVRRPAADSESELLAAAEAVLVDPAVEWEECGTWRTDGPAVLMDSAEAGADLGVEYPDGGGLPEQAFVLVPPGHWTVRAVQTWANGQTWVGLVQLLPVDSRRLRKRNRKPCSPHPRGWSRCRTPRNRARALLPTSAGVIPVSRRRWRTWWAASRACGDGSHQAADFRPAWPARFSDRSSAPAATIGRGQVVAVVRRGPGPVDPAVRSGCPAARTA
ncbi:MAG TPA: Imm21 family immunity protein, partial [Streptomyces sp.]|uniref:Imm21 family immunity protein n=1 Tax=Streptomyces sp. TaxID=1931 RepID=UPI002D7519B5